MFLFGVLFLIFHVARTSAKFKKGDRRVLTALLKRMSKADFEREIAKEFFYLERAITVDEFNFTAAKANWKKNRYKDVLAAERTRVRLEEREPDYINANYVSFDGDKQKYIASQGPMKNTVYDHWTMIWEQNVKVVVMLTKLSENGVEKCLQYWPDDNVAHEDAIARYGTFVVSFVNVTSFLDYNLQYFQLRNGLDGADGVARTVAIIQYVGWPDRSFPHSTDGFVAISGLAERLNAENEAPDSLPPLLVHCSAGIGRTGTFITIHSVVARARDHWQRTKVIPKINVSQAVFELRKQRPRSVQTKDQLLFAYLAVAAQLGSFHAPEI